MSRHYSQREKVTAVIAAEMTSNLAVERATGIPNQTVGRWRSDPDMRTYIDKTREQRLADTEVMVGLVVDTIIDMVRSGKFEPKELVTLFGVGMDKIMLLSGEATTRTETRDITGTISDADIREAVREAERLLGTSQGRTAPPTEGTPEG